MEIIIISTEAAYYLFLTINELLDSPHPNLTIAERENNNCLERNITSSPKMTIH